MIGSLAKPLGIGRLLISKRRFSLFTINQWPTATLPLVKVGAFAVKGCGSSVCKKSFQNFSEMPGKPKRVCIVGSGNW